MAERKQIAIAYQYTTSWMGGVYYLLNIVNVLNLLPDSEKPELLILYNVKSPIDLVRNTMYPYLIFTPFTFDPGFFKKVLNKFSYYLLGRKLFIASLPSNIKSNVYPLSTEVIGKKIKNAYYWIPDLQSLRLPEVSFSKRGLIVIKNSYKRLSESKESIVFSSQTALNDFDFFYPQNLNTKRVFRFASFGDEHFKNIDLNILLQKFSITTPYFIISNQFWEYKNHLIAIKAAKLLKSLNANFQLILTGRELDGNNSSKYANELKSFVAENGLSQHVKFLGYIDRNEQLQLTANAKCIIQPSLFEGWSTVVEDAKVLSQIILVSDIPIHREQITENCFFFSPEDASELAKNMQYVLENEVPKKSIDYRNFQISVAKDFLALFN